MATRFFRFSFIDLTFLKDRKAIYDFSYAAPLWLQKRSMTITFEIPLHKTSLLTRCTVKLTVYVDKLSIRLCHLNRQTYSSEVSIRCSYGSIAEVLIYVLGPAIPVLLGLLLRWMRRRLRMKSSGVEDGLCFRSSILTPRTSISSEPS